MPYPRVSNPENLQEVRRILNGVVGGRLDVVVLLTLRASETTTTITHPRIHPGSFISFMAKTASSNTALAAGVWIEIDNIGSATIHHGSYADTDMNMNVLIIG